MRVNSQIVTKMSKFNKGDVVWVGNTSGIVAGIGDGYISVQFKGLQGQLGDASYYLYDEEDLTHDRDMVKGLNFTRPFNQYRAPQPPLTEDNVVGWMGDMADMFKGVPTVNLEHLVDAFYTNYPVARGWNDPRVEGCR
jgi:hypothetical protein